MIEIVHIDDDNFTILMKYSLDENKDFEFRELLYRGGSDQTACGEYHIWELGEYIRWEDYKKLVNEAVRRFSK